MSLSETRKGELAIFGHSLLLSLFPVITVLAYRTLPPFTALFFSSLFALVFFSLYLSFTKSWQSIINSQIWKDLLVVGIVNAFGYYCLYFWGLKHTTPGNAAIVALMEIFFSYLLFNVWKKEEFSFMHIVGALLMVIGALVILLPKGSSIRIGDYFILLASFITLLGNFYQRKTRKTISAANVLFWRYAISLPLLLITIKLFGEHFSHLDLNKSVWFLLINGFVLLGLAKILFIESIHRISVVKSIALNSWAPALTLVWAMIILGQKPQASQLWALLPIFIGIMLLTWQSKSEVETEI